MKYIIIDNETSNLITTLKLETRPFKKEKILINEDIYNILEIIHSEKAVFLAVFKIEKNETNITITVD